MQPHLYQNLHWYPLTSSKNIWPKISVAQCFSTGIPRVAARGFPETDRNCLGRNSRPQFCAVAAMYHCVTAAQGSMSNANICWRFRCSKKVEKHWRSLFQKMISIYFYCWWVEDVTFQSPFDGPCIHTHIVL